MSTAKRATSLEVWPELPLDAWQATYRTLHMWLQIVGKTRLALAPMQNHWWQVALYVSARGLTTSPIPCGERTFEIELDLIDHELMVRTNDDLRAFMPLVPRTVADFFREYLNLLDTLGLDVSIDWPVPVEITEAIPFAHDRVHASYNADTAQRCWNVMVQVDRVLKEFRGRFIGKCSPVHFWWGGFDLACTRFSGRRAPPHPGGIPNTPDWVAQEAYSHECISAGWWPGNEQLPEPAFYAYIYPEPVAFPDATVRPAGAYYHEQLHEFVLPYDVVRNSAHPELTLLTFLQSTYAAAADLAGWPRAALEARRLTARERL